MRAFRTALLLVVVLVASSAVASGVAHAGPGSVEAERAQFLASLNQLRASQGLPPLQVDPELTAVAQQWAESIATTKQMGHRGDPAAGISTPWLRLGENVAHGSTTDITWQGLLESPSHYRNMVDPGFTHVGIGVAWADGVQYIAQKFMEAAPAPVFEPPPVRAPEPPPPPAELPPPIEPPAQVLPQTVERVAINVAVIPPIRYGELAVSVAPAADPGDDGDGPPLALLIAGAVALLLGATALAARSRRSRAG